MLFLDAATLFRWFGEFGAADELDALEWLIANHSGVVPWRDRVGVTGGNTDPAAVVGFDVQLARNAESNVAQLAGIGTYYGFDAVGPGPTWFKGHTADCVISHRNEIQDGLVRTACFVGGVVGLYFEIRDNIDTHGFSQGRGSRITDGPGAWLHGHRDACLPPL